jgi:hypothetical protein
MFGFVIEGPAQFQPVGILIIFSLLLIYTLLTLVYRLSKKLNSIFVFISIGAVSGIINGACLLYLSLTVNYYSPGGFPISAYNVQISAIFFGLVISTATWMSGFSVFTAIIEKNSQVKLAYILTLIQFVLIIACTVFTDLTIHEIPRYNDVNHLLFITIVSLRWLYFLLFFVLVVQHRRQLTRLGKIVLIAFGVLNTIVFIVEVEDLNRSYFISATAYFVVHFFFTDFLSAASMALIITFYKNITAKEEQLNDN